MSLTWVSWRVTAWRSSMIPNRIGGALSIWPHAKRVWYRSILWPRREVSTAKSKLCAWTFLFHCQFTKKYVFFHPRSWFFENVLRKEADKLLLAEENPRGTFLVRPSEHNPNGYSLSVKDWEDGRGYHVKHYRIKPLDNGGFYIATNQTFPSLQALVMAYSSKYRSHQ